MEANGHVLYVQKGAERLAACWELEKRIPPTEKQGERCKEREPDENDGRSPARGDTVGCVVLDESGEIVAGTSTGGTSGKALGRVGDSPIPGAGAYATRTGGVSTTGHGESIMKVLLAKEACDLMERGASPRAANLAALSILRTKTGSTDAGMISLSNTGEIGAEHLSGSMPVVYWRQGMTQPAWLL